MKSKYATKTNQNNKKVSLRFNDVDINSTRKANNVNGLVNGSIEVFKMTEIPTPRDYPLDIPFEEFMQVRIRWSYFPYFLLVLEPDTDFDQFPDGVRVLCSLPYRR